MACSDCDSYRHRASPCVCTTSGLSDWSILDIRWREWMFLMRLHWGCEQQQHVSEQRLVAVVCLVMWLQSDVTGNRNRVRLIQNGGSEDGNQTCRYYLVEIDQFSFKQNYLNVILKPYWSQEYISCSPQHLYFLKIQLYMCSKSWNM